MSFTKVNQKGDVPSERSLTAIACVGNLVYLFGGSKYGEAYNDTFVFNTESCTWAKLDTKGEVPNVRWGHTATAVKSKIFIFGGSTIGGDKLTDLYVFDTETSTWSRPDQTGQSVSARMNHSATLVKDKIFYFGGDGVDSSSQSLIVLDTTKMEWSVPQQGGEGLPEPRKGHAVALYKNKLVIFSGWSTVKFDYLDDIWLLDTDTMKWSRGKKKGATPPGRLGSCSAVFKDTFFLWGGKGSGNFTWNELHYMDVDDFNWLKRKGMGTVPSERYYVANCVVQDKLWLFGGQLDDKQFLNEMYTLNTSGLY